MANTRASVPGTLYVVATPIGNLDDISLRAIATLQAVDAILAEDTRHSQQLLNALGIKKPLISFHAHNEADKYKKMIEDLRAGKSFALISDAGTPLISDPGFVLVREAQREHIAVIPIPGPSALIAAISVAGVPCDNFFFAGFLPAKHQARLSALQTFYESGQTCVVYESTHRIVDAIDDVCQVFGEDYVFVLAKELTKSFEHIMQGRADSIKAWLMAEKAHSKGEFVLIFPAKALVNNRAADEKLLGVLLAELPLKQAVRIASALSTSSKNDLYQLALLLGQGP